MKNHLHWAIKPYFLKVAMSNRFVYGWVVKEDTGQVIAAASTVEQWLRDRISKEKGTMSTSDQRAAAVVGTLLAERAREAGVEGVSFVKPKGMKYDGKLKSLVEAVKAAGVPLI